MIDNRIDTPFLTKFNRKSSYLKSEDELYASIMQEIGNILSTKLKTREIDYDSPYSYGVRDLQSIDTSEESKNMFKDCCREAILKFEPRVSDVDIIEIRFNNISQSIEIELSCQVPLTNGSFATKMSLSN